VIVLFAGGGTGGHLMPALSIADAMVVANPTVEPFFVGAERGIEAQVLPARPWRYALFPFEPIYRRQWWRNVRLPWTAWRSLRGVREVLRRENPVLAVGTGGYASGPALWAASGRGIPIVIQEQNAYPGFATRRLAGRAAQVHLGFPEARRFLRAGATTVLLDSGNPIVPPPPAKSRRPKAEAKKDLGFDPGKPLVLVTGGSQGSVAMNEAVAAALTSGVWPKDAQLLWQTGAASYDRFKHLSAFSIQLSAFLDPIANAFAAADLVVARGGASTAADIAVWGLPSIVVPLPSSAAGHQLVNGRALEAAGAAVLLEQHNLTAASLVATVGQLLADPARMAGIAAAAVARARPHAAAEIARQALQLVAKS